MKTFVKPGVYKHYKGKLYQVIGTCHHSETLEEFVVYKALYNCAQFGNEPLWVRPVAMFLETVTVDGVEQPRFAVVEKEECCSLCLVSPRAAAFVKASRQGYKNENA